MCIWSRHYNWSFKSKNRRNYGFQIFEEIDVFHFMAELYTVKISTSSEVTSRVQLIFCYFKIISELINGSIFRTVWKYFLLKWKMYSLTGNGVYTVFLWYIQLSKLINLIKFNLVFSPVCSLYIFIFI